MMRPGFLAVAVGVAAAISCPATAQDRASLAPSSPWTLDYADDSCALRRMFGEGGEQVFLEFRRFHPIGGLQTVIATSWMTARNQPEVRYRFSGNAEWREAPATSLTATNGFSGVVFGTSVFDLPEAEGLEEELEQDAYLWSVDWRALEKDSAARKSSITVRGAFRREISLEVGPLDKPVAALQECIDELLTHWEIDVEAHKSLTRPAWPINLTEVPQMMGYPPEVLRQSMPGLVNIRLSISETGQITGCHIQMPLSDPAFEESSCADIRHALEFVPALDKNGEPIASYWATTIRFELR